MTCEETKESTNKKQEEVPEDDNDVESEEKAEAEEQVITKRYYGESHRSGGERQAKHAYDYRKKKKDSHMFKHLQEEHPGKEPSQLSQEWYMKKS